MIPRKRCAGSFFVRKTWMWYTDGWILPILVYYNLRIYGRINLMNTSSSNMTPIQDSETGFNIRAGELHLAVGPRANLREITMATE